MFHLCAVIDGEARPLYILNTTRCQQMAVPKHRRSFENNIIIPLFCLIGMMLDPIRNESPTWRHFLWVMNLVFGVKP